MSTPAAPTRFRSSPRAFTLVETLVVICILAILTALVVPAVDGMRDRGLATECLSNLRQLAVGQATYASDNNGSFTPAYTSESGLVWQARLLPYLSVRESENPNVQRADASSIFNCPAREDRGEPREEVPVGNSSIGLNNFMLDPVHWDFRANRVERPSRTILMAEMTPGNWDYLATSDHRVFYGSDASAPTPGFRHAGGRAANAVFCDGHVEALSVEDAKFASGLWKWWDD